MEADEHEWRALFSRIEGLPANSDPKVKRQRGYDFELALRLMFEAASMNPRSRYRPDGEEIDGSFFHWGRPMLFEAKWTADPVPASVLYQFRGKVEGKLVGTLGVFISMAGYAKDAVDALVAGKALNLVLFDGADMRKIALPGGITIAQALDLKLRAAAEEGTPFVSLPDDLTPRRPKTVAVVVEGRYDVMIINALLEGVGEPPDVVITPAGGHINLPLAALAQLSLQPSIQRIIILANGDGAKEEVRRQIEQTIQTATVPSGIELEVLVADPNLETALGLVGAGGIRPPAHTMRTKAKHVDLRAIASSSPDLARLFRALNVAL